MAATSPLPLSRRVASSLWADAAARLPHSQHSSDRGAESGYSLNPLDTASAALLLLTLTHTHSITPPILCPSVTIPHYTILHLHLHSPRLN